MKSTSINIFVICLTLTFSSLSFADVEIGEDRYDENTEITIRGTVEEVLHMKSGPVVIKVRSGNRAYSIMVGPSWYVAREGIAFQLGSELEISGSKYFGRDGNLYIISRQIKYPDGSIVILRDKMFRPMWRGMRMQNTTQ